MIELVRLDERLIHGQVATKWSKVTGVDRIIVANDAAANNEIIKKSLMMAANSGIKLAIRGVDDACALANNPKAANLKILMIADCPKDVLRIVEQCKNSIKGINIGNYGRIAEKRSGEDRTSYAAHLYLYDDEREQLSQLTTCSIPAFYQVIPDDIRTDLTKVLNK